MRWYRRLCYPVCAVVLLVTLPAAAAARDWYEPTAVINPLLLRSYEAPAVFPGGFAETIYANQVFQDGRYDTFQINARSGHTIFAAPRFALSATYGSYLMNGPVNEGGTPGSRLQWLMNAVQFEYGFYAAYDLGPLYLLGEYSRTSQHPFRKEFSQVSSDLIKFGFAPPRLSLGPVELYGFIRFGYSAIFDFWESRLEQPRAEWLMQPSVRAVWEGVELGNVIRLGLFFEGDAEIAVAREARFAEAGEIIGNGAVKSGLRLRSVHPNARKTAEGRYSDSPGHLDLYLDYYGSGNSEIRDDRKTPVQLLGYAFRFRLFY